VLPESYRYATWLVLGTPLMAFSLIADSTFRSQGDTVTPMKSMILGNGINAILDPIMIFTFGWGIAGASIATFIGRLAMPLPLVKAEKTEPPHTRLNLEARSPAEVDQRR